MLVYKVGSLYFSRRLLVIPFLTLGFRWGIRPRFSPPTPIWASERFCESPRLLWPFPDLVVNPYDPLTCIPIWIRHRVASLLLPSTFAFCEQLRQALSPRSGYNMASADVVPSLHA